MAQEYEVREEFRSHSLSQLMDDPVLCFQGVGEIQAELLKQYFGISTVRELANWTQFLWALEIQELAVDGGEFATTPIRKLQETASPKFQVREKGLDLTPEQLLNASVQDLENLTPAQDLALYDIFRITNIAQLAHNRIMLEARVIQYLEGQSRGTGTSENVADGVDSVLARQSSAAASATQRITEGRRGNRDERLHTMETETRDHVKERLAALKERARGRALTAAGGGQSARAASIAAGASTSAGAHRLETLRATRERADTVGVQARAVSGERMAAVAGRRTTMAGGAMHDRGTLDDNRTLRRPGGDSATGAVLASRGLAGNRTGGGLSSRAASVLASRSSGAASRTGGPGSYVGRGGGAGGGSATATATRTTTTSTTTTTTVATAPAAAVAAAAVSAETGTLTGQARGGRRGMMIAAAAVLVLLAVVLYFALNSRKTSAPGSAGQPGVAGTAPGQPGTQSTGTAAGPGTAAGTGPTTGTGTSTGAVTSPAAAGTAGSSAQSSGSAVGNTTATSGQVGTAGSTGSLGSAKTLHTVQAGQSLWRISRRYYSIGHDWPVIYKENQDQIKEPSLIYPKQQLRIPAKP